MDQYSRLSGLFLISLLSLAGCTYNPLARDNQLTGSPGATAAGAGIGLGTTILLGAPRPIVGLAGLVGGSVGYYVSSLRYASGGIISAGGLVYQVGDFVTIEVPTDKLFDSNSDEFLPGTSYILDSIRDVLARYPQDNIMISGNTSGFASAKYEHKISEDRARQVAAYLWAKGITAYRGEDHALSPRRLIYVGYGNYFPIANNIKLAGIRANSRIQITAFPSNQLIHDKRYKLFNNVGDLGEPRQTSPEKEPIDFNKLFPPGAPPGEVYKERRDLEMEEVPSEIPPDENTISGRSHKHVPTYSENYGGYDGISNVPNTSAGISDEKQGGKKDWLWSNTKSSSVKRFKDE